VRIIFKPNKKGKSAKMTATGGTTGPGSKSPVKIFANIFISFIGAGVLGLPFAFKEVYLNKHFVHSGLDKFFLGHSLGNLLALHKN
jgi:hypothetical protein